MALVTVQAVFGTWPIVAKLAFTHFSPLGIAAIRTVGGAILLWPIAKRWSGRKLNIQRDGWYMAGLAILGVVLNQWLFITGVQKTTAINTTLIITTIPVFTYIFAVMLGREKLGPKRVGGIIMAMSGVAVIIGISGARFGLDHLVGDVLIFANCISFSAYLALSKPLAERVNPLSLVSWQFIVAAFVFIPVGLWDGVATQVVQASGMAWAIIAYVILGPTVLTYILNATAMQNVSSSTVAVFIYIQPVITTILAWYVLGEKLTWTLVPGAILVFGGVGIVAWRSRVASASSKAIIAEA